MPEVFTQREMLCIAVLWRPYTAILRFPPPAICYESGRNAMPSAVESDRRRVPLVALRARLLLSLSSCAVALLAAEAGLRMTGRVLPPPALVTSARADLYQSYPPYGYRLWPSRTAMYEYPREHPRRLTLHSNRDGFRSARELDEPDDRTRVIVLGDSMVFGDGVEEVERFTDQLEADGCACRVDNLGMTGFGPDLMLRAFEQVGLKLKPDVVVMTIYTDDLRRVRPEYAGAGFEIPKFVLRSGRLVSIEYPRSTFWTRWSIVAAIRQVRWRRSGAEWSLNAAVLDRLRAYAATTRFKLVLMFLPGTSDTGNDQQRRFWLRTYAERTDTPFVDMTDPLHSMGTRHVFIPENWHLNQTGHQVVARELRLFLDALGFIPAGRAVR